MEKQLIEDLKSLKVLVFWKNKVSLKKISIGSSSICAKKCGDEIGFEPTLSKINIKNSNVGRPRKNPNSLYADKIYDTKKIRKYLRDRDIISNILINKKTGKP
jgi:hypothetical protein